MGQDSDMEVSVEEKGRLEWMIEKKKLVRAARVYDGSGSWLEFASSFASSWLLKVNAREIDKCGSDNSRANRL